MVGATGVEPARIAPQDPKSCVSANSTTRPLLDYQHFIPVRSAPIFQLHPCFVSLGFLSVKTQLETAQTTEKGTSACQKIASGVRFLKCQTCCNTSATAITMAESKSVARRFGRVWRRRCGRRQN